MSATWRLIEADCIEAMRELPASSVDAIVTDPPYGLEFMGKAWDSFRVDDPGTNRHRGEHAGSHGEIVEFEDRDGRRSPVGYGGGKRPSTFRCEGCGKRDQFRNAHGCPEGTAWRRELIDPHAAPPTMLAFQEWCRTWALEAARVLKPGGHLVAFGGTRTYHRLACAIEDAGFEIRDTLDWLYGSGFPKSLDVSKAIDKAAGAPREVVAVGSDGAHRQPRAMAPGGAAREAVQTMSDPATPDAERWQGWGTALKPAHEPIVLARKPMETSVAANVLEHGTGALNVDGTRIGVDGGTRSIGEPNRLNEVYGDGMGGLDVEPLGAGRWPANVILGHSPDCKPTGETRTVKAQQTRERSPDGPPQATWSLGREGGTQVGYGDEDALGAPYR